MTDEQHARIALESLFEILEDIPLPGPRHTDIKNNVNIIKDALTFTCQFRERIKDLKAEIKELEDKLLDKRIGNSGKV